jgi:hypothetical protein
MTDLLLTPQEAMAALCIKDRHTLARLADRGRIERFDVSGGTKQARWRYRLLPLLPEPPAPDLEELHWRKIKRGHGL